jgi:hypothetical protein
MLRVQVGTGLSPQRPGSQAVKSRVVRHFWVPRGPPPLNGKLPRLTLQFTTTRCPSLTRPSTVVDRPGQYIYLDDESLQKTLEIEGTVDAS